MPPTLIIGGPTDESDVADQAIDVQFQSTSENTVSGSFQHGHTFPSDMGLYQQQITDADLKDLLAKHGAFQPNEDQVTFPTNDDGRITLAHYTLASNVW